MRIHIGNTIAESLWFSSGEPVYLEDKAWESHLHCVGLSRTGKSILVYYILKQLVRKGKSFCLIDPHGSLYRDVLGWLVANSYRQPLILFNPSYLHRIVGFNPFRTIYRDDARIMTKAERLTRQLLHVFNVNSSDQYGNIENYLRAFFYTILDRELSIRDLRYFLYWEYEKERAQIIENVTSQWVKDEFNLLYKSERDFPGKINSTKNRIQRLIHPQMRRILGLRGNNINLPVAIEKQRSILCNLQAAEDDLIGRENMRTLGTLFISEIWELFRKKTKPQEFYLICDEAQEFFTPDLIEILPQSAKRGLHLLLFHQDPGQLTPEMASAIKNAQTKIYFSTEENLKNQRRFTLRHANGETMECEMPLLTLRPASEKRVNEYVEYMTQYFLTPEQVDAKLRSSHNEATPSKETEDDTQDGWAAR